VKRAGPRIVAPDELAFQAAFVLAIGAHPSLRIWRQNTGSVPVRNQRGVLLRYFHAGPPVGAADLSGIAVASGRRVEIELKSANGTRSPEQIRWADFITASRGVYVLVAYDAALSLPENVAAGVRAVLSAVDAS
jgi:hypothetical protein